LQAARQRRLGPAGGVFFHRQGLVANMYHTASCLAVVWECASCALCGVRSRFCLFAIIEVNMATRRPSQSVSLPLEESTPLSAQHVEVKDQVGMRRYAVVCACDLRALTPIPPARLWHFLHPNTGMRSAKKLLFAASEDTRTCRSMHRRAPRSAYSPLTLSRACGTCLACWFM
jgi:hypothetical protein